MRVLTLNTGSSSLKAALYRIESGSAPLPIEDRSTTAAHLSGPGAFTEALHHALDAVLPSPPDAIGHRLVAPQTAWPAPRNIDDALLAELRRLIPLAPDHLPQALAAIEAARAAFPGVPQIACSDSTFHGTLPEVARAFALPRRFRDQGLLRYGYHGLSCEYVVEALRAADPAAAMGRVVIAHLGNGASMTAVHDGESRDTTMGFTPLGGLPMSTRSGDLDPGVLIYLLCAGRLTPEALNQLLNHDSGMRGVSGVSGDMKELLEDPRPEAAAAVAVFVYQARKFLGALAAVLGGLDTLVFTGGIGENSAPVRARIAAGMEWFGLQLDENANAAGSRERQFVVSSPAAPVTVRVIRTDEDSMIARHTAKALSGAS